MGNGRGELQGLVVHVLSKDKITTNLVTDLNVFYLQFYKIE
jgi:hypothetical protein